MPNTFSTVLAFLIKLMNRYNYEHDSSGVWSRIGEEIYSAGSQAAVL